MMRYLFWICFLLFVACTQYVDTPKHKLSKDEMATIIAELSLNEDALLVNPQASIQEGTLHILKKHQITDEDFRENYTYYLAKKEMENILQKAQQKIVDMHPKAEEYIQKKEKGAVPTELMNP